jgi:flavodoxin
MKGLILYQSKTGKTRRMAEEIKTFLNKNNVEIDVTPINEFKKDNLGEYNMVFLGCWTSGFMVFGQRPEKDWINFAHNLPELNDKMVGLFTTYKIAAGSMFKNMKKQIPGANGNIKLQMKSRDGSLSVTDQLNLLELMK